MPAPLTPQSAAEDTYSETHLTKHPCCMEANVYSYTKHVVLLITPCIVRQVTCPNIPGISIEYSRIGLEHQFELLLKSKCRGCCGRHKVLLTDFEGLPNRSRRKTSSRQNVANMGISTRLKYSKPRILFGITTPLQSYDRESPPNRDLHRLVEVNG